VATNPIADHSRDIVRWHYPEAHPIPAMGGFWIVTGTGYTLAWASTEETAWQASAKLLTPRVEMFR
jgi:hypothetical protein